MKKILIVGQGVAGTMLAWALRRRRARVYVAEADLAGSSSPVAAGIINPITGKRFVKSWRFDEFFPAAQNAYQALERELGIDVWSGQSIVRLLANAEEENDWSARCALPDYHDFLSGLSDAGAWSPLVKPGWSFGLIRNAARVNFPRLLTAFREKIRSEGFFISEQVEYEDIERLEAGYDHIVFCEGFRGSGNPWFPELAWQLAKGEALMIRFSNGYDTRHIVQMLKRTVTLVPVGEHIFWAGGSYQWHYPDLEPSEGECDYITKHLKEMLDAPFEIIRQVAGVRPTVKDRRPFLGQSTVNPKVFIYNGLGTKGALLAPYWAEHLAEHLLSEKPLDEDVDIRRFKGRS